MAFDWNQYYKLAEELRQKGEEAHLRSAISRVYYSVYCQARNFLEKQEGVPVPRVGAHKYVWGEYKGQGRTGRALSNNGARLHENRNRADYENELEELPQLVEESFALAERVLTYLDQIKKAAGEV